MARTCNAVFLGEHVEKEGGGQGADEDQTLALRVVEALGKYKPRVRRKESGVVGREEREGETRATTVPEVVVSLLSGSDSPLPLSLPPSRPPRRTPPWCWAWRRFNRSSSPP